MIRQFVKKVRKGKGILNSNWKSIKSHSPFLTKLSNIRVTRQYLRYCRVFAIEEHVILFEANEGESYSGSPKAMYLELQTDPQYDRYRFIWVVPKLNSYSYLAEDPRTEIVKKNTKKYYKAYARAKIWVTNQKVNPLYRKRHGQSHIYCMDRILDKQDIQEIKKTADVIGASSIAEEHFLTKMFGPKIPVLESGNPSVRYLMNHSVSDKQATKDKFHLPLEKSVILIYGTQGLGISRTDAIRIEAMANNQYIIIWKFESDQTKPSIEGRRSFFTKEECDKEFDGFLYSFNYIDDINELMLVADIFITNSLVAARNCSVLHKPIIYQNDEIEITRLYLGNENTENLPILITESGQSWASVLVNSFPEFTVPEPKHTTIDTLINFRNENSTKQLFQFVLQENKQGETQFRKNLKMMKTLCQCLLKVQNIIHQAAYKMEHMYPQLRERLKRIVLSIDIKIEKILSSWGAFAARHGVCFSKNRKKLLTYKNLQEGKRCFLIGNGPSLTTADLELLKNEITFACNRIYKLYPLTSWRPTYYCLIDAIIAKYEYQDVVDHVDCPFFTNRDTLGLMEKAPSDVICAKNIGESEYYVSDDFFSYYVPSGATVMTYMLELAMYMGFKEIYLIGVDCTSSVNGGGHFVKNYINPELLEKDMERIRKRLGSNEATKEEVAEYYFNKSMLSYQLIQEYAQKRDINIYNATRGGKLEIYKRRSLEEVL